LAARAAAARVLHVVQSGDRGGVQRHVRDLVLGGRQLTVGVAAGQEGWLTQLLQSAGVPVHHIPSLRRALDPWAAQRAAHEVRAVVDAAGANLVHAHGVFALLACRDLGGRPLVYTPHGFQWRDPDHPPWVRVGSRLVHRQLAPRVAAVVAVSGRDAADAVALGVPPEHVHHVPNGVALPGAAGAGASWRGAGEEGAPRSNSSPSPVLRVPPALGVAARLVPGKGVDEAIRLLAALSGGVELHVAGVGPEEQRLRRLARRSGVGTRVRWLGWQDDLGPFYRRLAVYVTFSRKEGLPYALLDALAHGVPVVASDIPGHAEVLAGSAAGMLVRRGEGRLAARRMQAWLRDPEAWQTASRAARALVRDRFDLGRMLQRHATLYASLMAAPTAAD
jgi:glycosyltransferase involved in cell wall biosynthesis